VGLALTGSPALRQIRDESSHDANYVARAFRAFLSPTDYR